MAAVSISAGRAPGISGGVVEGVDLGGDGGVFVGHDPVGDAGVGEGHLHGAVPEEGGDGFETHPSVDGLGGESVAELVGVDGADPGFLGGGGDDAVHGAAVDGRMLIGEEPMLGSDVVSVVRGPFGQERHQIGVKGNEPVVAELSDRDSEPVGVADQGDGIRVELAQLAGA